MGNSCCCFWFGNTDQVDSYTTHLEYATMVAVEHKARELRAQFGVNAKYVALEVLDVLKALSGADARMAIIEWKAVKKNLTHACPKSPTGKHEYTMGPDSFDTPYCKYCYNSD